MTILYHIAPRLFHIFGAISRRSRHRGLVQPAVGPVRFLRLRRGRFAQGLSGLFIESLPHCQIYEARGCTFRTAAMKLVHSPRGGSPNRPDNSLPLSQVVCRFFQTFLSLRRLHTVDEGHEKGLLTIGMQNGRKVFHSFRGCLSGGRQPDLAEGG